LAEGHKIKTSRVEWGTGKPKGGGTGLYGLRGWKSVLGEGDRGDSCRGGGGDEKLGGGRKVFS